MEQNEVKHKFRIRKLTPKECLRLMDVNEEYIPVMTDGEISNTQLYKMAGNSIVVACLEHIFRQLLTTDRDEIEQPTLF